MNKKEYIQPTIKTVVLIENACILAGSDDNISVGGRDEYDENASGGSGAKRYDSDYFDW